MPNGADPKPFKGPDDYYDSGVGEFPAPARAFLLVCCAVVWLFSKIYWRWSLSGGDPFGPGREGGPGRVLIGNHASSLDPAIVVVHANLRGSRIRPLYKSELNANGLTTWFFSRIGGIPVKRGTADMKAIRRAVNALKRGEDVLVFPEGTRVWDPDARPELHGGFALIAQMAGSDILPFAIDGSELVCPDKKGFPRPAKVRLRFGEPVSPTQFEDVPRRERADAAEKVAMGNVYDMRRALRVEHGKPVGRSGGEPEGEGRP